MTDQEKDQILADYAESCRHLRQRIAKWEDFASQIARETGCLADYSNPHEDNFHIVEAIQKLKANSQKKNAELRQAAESIAGHIRQPMTAREIADALNSGDYNAELILQHLLRLVSDR